jgi:hypothetical protein
MRNKISCILIVISTGCDSICPAPAACPVDQSLSGAFDLILTQDTSTYNECTVVLPNFTHEQCDDTSVRAHEGLVPRRLYIADNGNHMAVVGLDNNCQGKIFDKHLISHCESKDVSASTSVWYDVSIDNGAVSGSMKYYMKMGDVMFLRSYTLTGSKIK